MTTHTIKVHAIYTDSTVNDLLVKQLLKDTSAIFMATNPGGIVVDFELASSEIDSDPALIADGPTSGVGLNFHLAREARAVRYPGKFVVIFRSPGGNESSTWADYVVMESADGVFFAHEVGHYLHLGHTFDEGITRDLFAANKTGGIDAAKMVAIDLIRKGGVGLGVFDGDAGDPDAPEGDNFARVGDTPPDPGPPLFQPSFFTKDVNGKSTAIPNEHCSAMLSLDVDGEIYGLAPDRTNVMGHFFGCTNFAYTVSPDQRRVIDRVLARGNRRHLAKGASPEAPAAVVTPDGSMHVFARGDDDNIWRNVRKGTVWSGWNGGELGAGTVTSGPAAVVTEDGFIHVFAQGLDRNIWHSWGKGEAWSGWTGGHMGAGTLMSAPTAVVTPDGAIHVFARGDDRNIWHNFWNKEVWSGWKGGELGAGTLSSGPAAVVTADGNIHVFARGDDRNIWHTFRNGDDWSGWKGDKLGNRALTSGPTAVVTADGAIHVFARGDDRNIWHIWGNGEAWSGWTADLPVGTFMSGLATVISGDQALYAFAQVDDRSIVHSFLNGKIWSEWGKELGGGTFQP